MERVSVGSLQDWNRVKNNYSSIATSDLDTVINDHDLHDERDALSAHLSHFLDSAFMIAQVNMRVNGHNFDTIEAAGQDVEAFDEALDRRIWSLADTRLQWHKRMAKTRRDVPVETQAHVSNLLVKNEEQVNESDPIYEDEEPMEGVEDEEQMEVSTPVPPEIAEGFHMTSAITQELDQNIPSQEERVQRAERATNQLRSLKY